MASWNSTLSLISSRSCPMHDTRAPANATATVTANDLIAIYRNTAAAGRRRNEASFPFEKQPTCLTVLLIANSQAL